MKIVAPQIVKAKKLSENYFTINIIIPLFPYGLALHIPMTLGLELESNICSLSLLFAFELFTFL